MLPLTTTTTKTTTTKTMLLVLILRLLSSTRNVYGFTSLVKPPILQKQKQSIFFSNHEASRCRFVLSSSRTTTTSEAGTMMNKLDGRKINGIVQPLNNFILVKTVPAIEATDGGILLTGKAKIKKTQGTVVNIGPGKTHQDSGILIPIPVNVNDGVVYGKYDGTAIDYNGEPHTLIRDDDILVKYTGDKLSMDTVDVINDNILVFVDNKKEEETEGGILIAKISKQEKKPSTGIVVKVGPGKMASNGARIPMDVNIGDMIKFRDYAGNEVDIDNKEYSVVKMVDVLAKF